MVTTAERRAPTPGRVHEPEHAPRRDRRNRGGRHRRRPLSRGAGPLAGSLGPVDTSINLSVSNCSPLDPRGYTSYTVAGFLVDADGRPVANTTVHLVGEFYPEAGPGISAVEQFVTRADGSFRVVRDVRPSAISTGDNYQASFGGDALYKPSTSERVYLHC